GVEALALVLFVVAGKRGLVERAQLHRDDRQTFALETAENLADETTLDGVRLEKNEGTTSAG
ncbi:MAG: hypothetical protein RIR54_892, partial [Actinomycetota bacterium]